MLRHQSSLVENTIPLTTKMVNRMKKKEPPTAAHQMARQFTQMSQGSLQHQSSIAGAAAAVGVPTVRRGGPGDAGADFLRRKVNYSTIHRLHYVLYCSRDLMSLCVLF